jgi:hypothetical protein
MDDELTRNLPDQVDRGFLTDWAEEHVPTIVAKYLPGFIAAKINTLPERFQHQVVQAIDYIIVLLQDTREQIGT